MAMVLLMQACMCNRKERNAKTTPIIITSEYHYFRYQLIIFTDHTEKSPPHFSDTR
jgi:hypothetical protein